MSLNEMKKRLKGRKIVRIEWNSFRTGRENHPRTTDPTLYLDDGTTVNFNVVETEVGEYGVEAHICPTDKAFLGMD